MDKGVSPEILIGSPFCDIIIIERGYFIQAIMISEGNLPPGL